MTSPINFSPYVFISYKREEIDQAKMMKDTLENQGFSVWWDENIQCGQIWSNVLDGAVRNASCIVVLWSKRSLQSRWVMHEASSAMDREIYAPVRIELISIDPPFNRYQASDLLDWRGEKEHPGFIDLQNRLNVLIPKPLPRIELFLLRVWNYRVTIISLVFGFAAISLLLWQLFTSNIQLSQLTSVVSELEGINKQQKLAAKDIERAIHPIEEVEVEMFINLVKGNPKVDNYIDRVSRVIDESLINGLIDLDVSVLSMASDSNGQNKPLLISYDLNSSLAPMSDMENDVGNLLYQSLYSLSFFADSVNNKQFEKISSKEFTPDLHYLVFTELEFIWDIKAKNLAVRVKTAKDGGIWSRTGKIISIPDLMRSWFFLKFASEISAREEPLLVLEPQKSLELRSLSISMTGGRRFILNSDDLTHHNSPDGIGYYSLDPEKWIQVMQLTSY